MQENQILAHIIIIVIVLAQWCPPLLHRQDMEQQLGSLILATDISRQNEFLLTFREHLDNQDLDLQLASHRHFILQVCLTPTSQYGISMHVSQKL